MEKLLWLKWFANFCTSRGCLPRFCFSQMWISRSGNTHGQLLSKRCFILNLLSLVWGSCMLVPGGFCGQLHLTIYSIVLGNFACLWNLLKSHFRDIFFAFQVGQLAKLARKCMFVCISKRWTGNNWKAKTAGHWERNRDDCTCVVSLPGEKWLSGRSKDAVDLRQPSVNWAENINLKVQTCALMWGVWNQPLAFVICLTTCGAQFPMAAFTREKE